MEKKKLNGTYKGVKLTNSVLSRAENMTGKQLEVVKNDNKIRTFKEKQRRRIAIGLKDEPFTKKFMRIMTCAPTPGKLPHPKQQKKFLDKVIRADYSAIQKALKYNQPVNYCDAKGRSGLYFASYYGYTPVAQLLVGYNADCNIADREKQQTPAHICAERGYGDILDVLLDKGADLTLKDKMGLTPLMHAANNGHYKTCMLIVECDIPIDMHDKRRWTALHYASQKGFHRICKYLAAQGWDSHFKDINGQTPLSLAQMELRAMDEEAEGVSSGERVRIMEKNAAARKKFGKVVNVLAEDMRDWRDVQRREEQKRLAQAGGTATFKGLGR